MPAELLKRMLEKLVLLSNKKCPGRNLPGHLFLNQKPNNGHSAKVIGNF